MKHVKPSLLIIFLLFASMAIGQVPVKESGRVETTDQKETLSPQEASKKFNALLKAAEEKTEVKTTVAALLSAKSFCDQQNVPNCGDLWEQKVVSLFNTWM